MTQDIQYYQFVADALTEYNTDNAKAVITAIMDTDEEAALLQFQLPEDGITTSALVYEDGTIFHLQDWQGDFPKTMDEVKEFDWLDMEGRAAVNMADKPRTPLIQDGRKNNGGARQGAGRPEKNRTRIALSIDKDIAEQLRNESNMSDTVNDALKEHYDIKSDEQRVLEQYKAICHTGDGAKVRRQDNGTYCIYAKTTYLHAYDMEAISKAFKLISISTHGDYNLVVTVETR